MKKKAFTLVELPVVRKRGFTLVELLVVIGIIAILTVIVVLNIQNAQAKARDVKRKADIKTIAAALEAYRSNKGVTLAICTATPNLGTRTDFSKIDRVDDLFGCGNAVWPGGDEPSDLIKNLITENYLPNQPRDPMFVDLGPRGYYFRSNAGSGNFKVVSYKPELLEGKTDPAECQTIAGEYFDPADPCNGYQVSSNSDATKDW